MFRNKEPNNHIANSSNGMHENKIIKKKIQHFVRKIRQKVFVIVICFQSYQ